MALKLKNLKPREKIMLAAAAAAVFCLICERTLVQWWFLNRWHDMGKAISVEQENLDFSTVILNMKDEVTAKYAEIEGSLSSIASTSEQIVDMKGEIDDMARSSGLIIGAMADKETKNEEFFDKYYVDIAKFEASIDSLLKFLYEIRISPGMLKVEKLSVTPDKNQKIFKGSMVITKVMVRTPDQSI